MTHAERLALFEQWQGLAHRLARRFVRCPERQHAAARRGLTVADLAQIGLAKVWRVSDRFDPSRGKSFGTFAGVCVWRAMYHAVGRRPEPLLYVERPELMQELATPPDAVVDMVDQRLQLADVTDALDHVPPSYRDVLVQHAAGETFVEIGQQAGVTRQAIHSRAQAAAAAVRELLSTAPGAPTAPRGRPKRSAGRRRDVRGVPSHPAPVEALTMPTVLCAWCHGEVRDSDVACPSCGHDAHKPRMDCRCASCNSAAPLADDEPPNG